MKQKSLIIFFGVLLGSFLYCYQAQAFTGEARITFTFDDSVNTTYTVTRPVMAAYKLPGVVYGETGPLNAGEDWVMTWQQVKDLQNKYGWEIGSHSINHPYLTQVTDEQLIEELAGSKQDFAAQGISVKSFATPYGDYNNKVLAAIAQYYESHRAAWGGPNHWPDVYNDLEVISLEVSNTTTVAEVKKWVNTAITNKQWLVLLFHEIVRGRAQPYQYNLTNFRNIVQFVASRPIKTMTFSQALKITDQPNLVSNYGFTDLDGSGWATGWERNDTTNVTIDTNSHGNVFGPTNSLKMVGGSGQREATTGFIPINGSTEYMLKVFENLQDLTSGGWVAWLDQYDSSDNWLGGQWLGGNYLNFVGYRYWQFFPISSAVSKIKIKIYTDINSQLTLYLDSVEVRALGSASTTPPPPPSPNLIANYSFENLTDGWANDWTRSDNINVIIDQTGQGIPPLQQNSLKITAGPDQNIAFSSFVTVNPASSYTLTYYQKILNYVSGGVAVWIDEYNSSGNWVSGQWLGGTYQAAQNQKSYSYKPTSSKVSKIQVHLFTEAGSQLTLYIDNVELRAVQATNTALTTTSLTTSTSATATAIETAPIELSTTLYPAM